MIIEYLSCRRNTAGYGLNLTRRILLGILKYPCAYARANRTARPPHELLEGPAKAWGPPKCYLDCEQGIVDWMLAPLKPAERDLFTSLLTLPTDVDCGETAHSTFDASIMTIADDIAYGIHDLEDGIAFRLIKWEHIKALDGLIDVVFGKVGMTRWNAKKLRRALFKPYKEDPTRKQAIGSLIHAMILWLDVELIEGFDSPLVKYRVKLSGEAHELLKKLKGLNKQHIIFSQPVQTIEFRGRKMVTEMFGAIMSEPSRLLDEYHRDRLERDFATDGKVARIVCDYVASMSDTYATRFYERLFVPGEGSAFERL